MNAIPSLRAPAPHNPVPRGILTSGPALFSYGFRPFFLLAGLWATVAMVLWIGALALGWGIGGARGALAWHGHEMLFGYASAALAGFMLTAIPNWTGRLPVAGRPLMVLVAIWLVGRAAMLASDALGPPAAMLLDGLFLPALAVVAGREIIAGRNWKNLKILGGLAVLSGANIWFHLAGMGLADPGAGLRAAIGAYIMLISLVGGRMVPSFTRNWLSRQQATRLPAPFGRYDQLAIGATLLAVLAWIGWPEQLATALLATSGAVLQGIRLWRWRGWHARHEPLVAVLHAGYGFVPLGLAALAGSAVGWMSEAGAMHLLTVGAIGTMILAVMTRASLGHTGRALTASLPTRLAYLAMIGAALCRPLAEALPQYYLPILGLSGGLWIIASALFVLEYAPILCSPKVGRRA